MNQTRVAIKVTVKKVRFVKVSWIFHVLCISSSLLLLEVEDFKISQNVTLSFAEDVSAPIDVHLNTASVIVLAHLTATTVKNHRAMNSSHDYWWVEKFLNAVESRELPQHAAQFVSWSMHKP